MPLSPPSTFDETTNPPSTCSISSTSTSSSSLRRPTNAVPVARITKLNTRREFEFNHVEHETVRLMRCRRSAHAVCMYVYVRMFGCSYVCITCPRFAHMRTCTCAQNHGKRTSHHHHSGDHSHRSQSGSLRSLFLCIFPSVFGRSLVLVRSRCPVMRV